MFSPRWNKVRRDLWSNKTRTVLVVLAIAVGVLAFGSVFVTNTALLTNMNIQYRASNASTITLYMDSFDDSLVRWAKSQPEVTVAEGKVGYVVKLIKGDKTYNLDIYASPDYKNASLNLVTPQSGTWPPGRGDIVFERSAAPFVGFKAGERVTVEMADGSRRELTAVGTVHDVNIIPATLFPELTGYVTSNTLALLGLPNDFNRLEILTKSEYDTVGKLEVVAYGLKERLLREGVQVRSTQIRKPGEHWAEPTSKSFTLILSFVGFFSLILSGFLVVNTMSALLTEQRRQIGIMKAVGGTGKQVIGIYLALVACYGVLALLVALPAGMGLAYLFTLSVVNFLNVDIVDFHLPGSVLLLQIIAALGVPAIASLVPIAGGVRITVREALSSYGINGKKRYGLIERVLNRIRRLPRPLILSLRNTFRRRGRLLLTLGTLTLAGTLFITVVNVRYSLMAELKGIMDSLFNYEVAMTLDGAYDRGGVERRAENVPGVVEAEARTSLSVVRIKPDGTEGANFAINGLPWDSTFVQPRVQSGRWLQDGDRNSLVITSKLIEDMPDVKVGDTITLKFKDKKYEWQVVGIVLMAFDKSAYADFNYASGLRGESGLATSVHVRTVQKDGKSQSTMAEILEQQLKDSGIKVVGSVTENTVSSTNTSQFDFLVSFLLAMAAMAAVIGGLGLAGLMSLNVLERTREIGVMRSIGASSGMIGGIVVAEGVLIGLISWALAIPLSLPINVAFNAMLGQAFLDKPLVYVFSPVGVIGWLAIVLVLSIVASLLPARRSIRMSVRETLAYE